MPVCNPENLRRDISQRCRKRISKTFSGGKPQDPLSCLYGIIKGIGYIKVVVIKEFVIEARKLLPSFVLICSFFTLGCGCHTHPAWLAPSSSESWLRDWIALRNDYISQQPICATWCKCIFFKKFVHKKLGLGSQNILEALVLCSVNGGIEKQYMMNSFAN